MPKKSLAKKIDHFTIQYHLGDTDNENDIDGDDNNSNHGVMMILSGQGVFLHRLSRLRLSTQGLFDSHTQCRALKVIRPAFSFSLTPSVDLCYELPGAANRIHIS